jgi:hypothetical protein
MFLMDMKIVEALFENLKRLVSENLNLRAKIVELEEELDRIYG